MSPNIEKGTCVSLIPQIREVDPSKWKPKQDLNQTKLGTKNKVDNRSYKVGSTQRITTNDNYFFPINIKNSLLYLKMRPYTDKE